MVLTKPASRCIQLQSHARVAEGLVHCLKGVEGALVAVVWSMGVLNPADPK